MYRTYLKELLPSFSFSNTPPPTTAPSSDDIVLSPDTSTTLTLPSGRLLGYAQYGSPNGTPILYQHGLPGSRLEGIHLHTTALSLNIRIIATDRPGIGLSSPHPGRTLHDWASDIQFLTETLHLSEYAVLGVSGGGPSALALARYLPPTHLKAIGLVCALGPPDIGMQGANWWHWLGFTLGWPYFPDLTGWYFERNARLHLSDAELLDVHRAGARKLRGVAPEKDVRILCDEEVLKVGVRGVREWFRQGRHGLVADGKVSVREWGFHVQDIRGDLPVRLWYGERDDFVPLGHGRGFLRWVGEGAVLRVVDETHVSVFFERRREVLEDLLGCM